MPLLNVNQNYIILIFKHLIKHSDDIQIWSMKYKKNIVVMMTKM